MEELREKLVETLTKIGIEKVGLISRRKKFTNGQLIDEINNKTDVGNKFVDGILHLTLDLLSRQRIKYEDD